MGKICSLVSRIAIVVGKDSTDTNRTWVLLDEMEKDLGKLETGVDELLNYEPPEQLPAPSGKACNAL